MSLLMDALRKAEEAKRAASQTDGGSSPAVAESKPEPVNNAPLNEAILAELALEPLPSYIEPAPLAASHPATRSVTPEVSADQAQRSIQNAFAAKTPTDTTGDRIFIFALAGVVALGLIGIGAYVWWQMQPKSSLVMAAPVTPGRVQPAAPLPPLPASLSPAPQTTANVTLPASTIESGTLKAALPASRDFTDTAKASPIRITHSRSKINPLLEQGYAALQQGNLPQAQQAYERMLSSDPKNVDALYGLAAIAVHRQQFGLAEEYYLRVLEVDPRDALAHAGLAGLKGGGNTESRLKTLLAEQPEVPQLHLALGNVYAQNQRWRDAQQSYFLAYKNDSENPDIAFNLAVSLDQLHQDRLAAQYYVEALRLATNAPATFNRAQAQQRLRELQGGTQP
jgi:tetratricopeptide (TPR) repeat protein